MNAYDSLWCPTLRAKKASNRYVSFWEMGRLASGSGVFSELNLLTKVAAMT